MSEHALRGVDGCGNMCGAYGETMSAYTSVRSADPRSGSVSSAAFVEPVGGVGYRHWTSARRPAVDAIVDLTSPPSMRR